MLDSIPVTCFRPLLVKNPRFRYPHNSVQFITNKLLHYRDYIENFYIEVPCGKCYLCRKKKANNWRVRLLEECKVTPTLRDNGIEKKRIIFVCFTYDDAHLPKTGARSEFAEHIKKWRDLWRKKFGCSPRYFAVTDKGSQYGRLHLHLLLFAPFNKNTGEYLSIEDLEKHSFFWRNGMVREPSWLESEKGISYVTGYLTGSNLDKDAIKHGKPICKDAKEYIPFVFVSNGLGRDFVDNPTISVDATNGNYLYFYQGFFYGLPSYWRYKLVDEEFRWHSNLLLKKEKEDYMNTHDVVEYSLRNQKYTFDSLEMLYRSSYCQYDTDKNKFIRQIYAK